jgi:quinol monooxygenase YgiN
MDAHQASFPTPQPSWAQVDPEHPGFAFQGFNDTPGKKAYFIHLEAKPGKEQLVQEFLQDINNGVNQEPGTGPWFGLRFSKSTFGIFEAFPDAAARHAHDNGPGGKNFLRSELLKEMLEYPAQLYRLDVLHGKFGVLFGRSVQQES